MTGSKLGVISGTHFSFTQRQEMLLARSAVFKDRRETKQRHSPPFEHNFLHPLEEASICPKPPRAMI